jgi:uncharacterized protein (TIGR00375 family)
MKVIAELHVHSRYARACSKDLNIKNLEKWSKVKGITLLGTGDFCHPEWIKELKSELKEDGTGILRTESGFPFILQNEISLMYSQGGKGRRIHLLILAPDFATVDKITKYLLTKGRIDYDGRPIFNISCIEFTKQMKEISDDIEVIPAHAWTPWFGIFGSKTGFDTLEEAFGPMAKHIHAIESGISSDPAMNRRLSKLDNVRIVSFSDAHSFWPWRLGREATIFDLKELTYMNVLNAIRTGKGFVGTIEADPSYGKYHFDGHRLCNVSMSPDVSNKINKICPVCHKPLTIGVLNRVEELADRKENGPKNPKDNFKSILPLHEIIAVVIGASVSSKKTWAEYDKIMTAASNEFEILLETPEKKLLEVTSQEIVELIMMNRRGEVQVKPGYDGEYGKILIGGKEVAPEDSEEEKPKKDGKKKTLPKSKGKNKGLSEFIK